MDSNDKPTFTQCCETLRTCTTTHHDVLDAERGERDATWRTVMARYWRALEVYRMADVYQAAGNIAQHEDRFPSVSRWREAITSIVRQRDAPVDHGHIPPPEQRERIRAARATFCDLLADRWPKLRDTAERIKAMPIRVPTGSGSQHRGG